MMISRLIDGGLVVIGTSLLLLIGALGGAVVELWPRAPWNPHLVMVLGLGSVAVLAGVGVIGLGLTGRSAQSHRYRCRRRRFEPGTLSHLSHFSWPRSQPRSHRLPRDTPHAT